MPSITTLDTQNAFKKNDYTLQVGENGSQRLLLLNELINPYSMNFIRGISPLKNKKILDVGCGTGIMASELSNQCLPSGSIFAIDISNEQLDLARKNAARDGLNNISFKQMSAFDIDKLNQKFDIVYYRFLLGHLPNAIEILQKSISLMHAESILICEEIENVDDMFCDPPNEAFNWWKQAVDIQIKACKGDFTVGNKLAEFFKQLNLTTISTQSIQPLMISPKLKQQLWLGIIEITPILISSGFATEEEISFMITELKKLADTSETKIGFFYLRQVAVKQPDASSLNSANNKL